MNTFDDVAYNDPVAAQQMVDAGRIPGPNGPNSDRWWADQSARPSPEIRKTTKASDRRNGYVTKLMPNGSEVCLSHDAPYELGVAMTAEWVAAWEKAGKERCG